MNETKASDVASVAVAMDGKFDHLTESMAEHAPKCKAKSPETCQYVLKEAAAEMEKPENKGKSKEEIIKQVAAQHEKFKAEGQARAAGGAPKDVKSDPNVRTQFDEAKKIVDSLPDAQKAEGQKIIQQMENEAARQNAQNAQNGAAQGGTDAAKTDAAATGGEQSADGAQNNGTAAQTGNAAQSAQPSDEERYAALMQRHATPKKEDKIAREKKYVMSKMESFRKEQEEKGTPEWKIQEGEDKIWAEHQERLNQIEQDFAGTDGGADGGADGGTDATASAETNTAETASAEGTAEKNDADTSTAEGSAGEGSTGETGTAETTTAEGGSDGSTAETSTDTTTAEGSTAEGRTGGSTGETSTAETTTASTGTESGTTTEGSTSSSTSTEGGSTSTSEGSTAPEEKIIEKDGKKYLDISHLSFFPAMFRALKEGWKGNVNGIIYDRKAYLDKKKREAEEATKRGETAEPTPAEKAKGMALFKAFDVDPDKMPEERRKDLEAISKRFDSPDENVRKKARSEFYKALRDYQNIDKMNGANKEEKAEESEVTAQPASASESTSDDTSSSSTEEESTGGGEAEVTAESAGGDTSSDTTAEASGTSGGTEASASGSGESGTAESTGAEGTGGEAKSEWKPEHQPHEDPVAEGTSAEEHAKVCKANPKSNCPFLKSHMSKEQLEALDGGSSDAGSSSSGSTASTGREGGGTSGGESASTAQKKDRNTLHKEMMDASSAYNDLVQKKENGDTSITDEQVNAAMKKWDDATEAYRNSARGGNGGGNSSTAETKADGGSDASTGGGSTGTAETTASAETGTASGGGEGDGGGNGALSINDEDLPELSEEDAEKRMNERTGSLAKENDGEVDFSSQPQTEEDQQNIDKIMSKITSKKGGGLGLDPEDAEVMGCVKGPIFTTYKFRIDGDIGAITGKKFLNNLGFALGQGDAAAMVEPLKDGTYAIMVKNKNPENVGLDEPLTSKEYLDAVAKRPNAVLVPTCKDAQGRWKFIDLTKGPHMMVTGGSGQGKSVFLNSVLASIMHQYHGKVMLGVLDPKGTEMGSVDGYKNTLTYNLGNGKTSSGVVHGDANACVDAIINLKNVMISRNKMLQRAGKAAGITLRNLGDYNDWVKKNPNVKDPQTGKPFKPQQPIIQIVDEFKQLQDVAKEQKRDKELMGAIGQIVQLSRSSGVHCIFATQNPDVNSIPSTIATNCQQRVAFKAKNQYRGSPMCTDLLHPGDMRIDDGKEVTRGQSPFVDEGSCNAIASGKRLKAPPPKAKPKTPPMPKQKEVEEVTAESAGEAKQDASGTFNTSSVQQGAQGGEKKAAAAQTNTATTQKQTAAKPAPKRTDGDIGLKDSEKLQPSERLQAGETASGSTAQTATATEQKKAAPQPAKPKKRKWTKQEISQQAETNKQLSQQLIDMVKSVHGGARESVKKGRKYLALKAKRDEGFARMKAMNDGVEYVPQGTPTTDSASPHELIASIVRATAKFRERDLAGKLTVKARIARTLHRRNPDEPIV